MKRNESEDAHWECLGVIFAKSKCNLVGCCPLEGLDSNRVYLVRPEKW